MKPHTQHRSVTELIKKQSIIKRVSLAGLVFVVLLVLMSTVQAQSPEVMARDNRFIAYDNGTVLDTWTNLMWAAHDNASGINWYNAKSYCENYRGGGYTDWRMPTQGEVAGLYNAGKTYTADCGLPVHLTELIHLTCCCPWASETRGSDAAGFNFLDGTRFWNPQSGDSHYRALPVRSGK